ncbi:MAG TPA: MoaD/ThiS family protein [Rhodanobacteraceae bacterium]|nr:MoaD/ThiS family protein [Rhodanobacteraceae bacterium]
MPKVVLSSALSRWLPPAEGAQSPGEIALQVPGASVGEALEHVFAQYPNLRGYVLDEHGTVRHHLALFVDGAAIANKRDLSQAIGETSEIYVMQALSGG